MRRRGAREDDTALENNAWRRGGRHGGGVHSKYTIPLKQGGHNGGGDIAGQRRRDKKRKGRKSEGGRVSVLLKKGKMSSSRLKCRGGAMDDGR